MDNKGNLQKLQAILQRQVALVKERHFSISDCNEEEIRESLWQCYRAEVAKRQVPFVDDNETKQRVAKCAKWLTGNYRPGLMLYGRIGSGKSTIARAMCNLIGILNDSPLYSERKCVKQVSALEMSSIVRADDTEIFHSIKTAELLFIDDIGLEPSTVKVWGNEVSPVVDIIYSRYDNQRFTIVTSNLKGDQFRERYGDRIGDRMLEMFEQIEFNQTLSYRK